MDKKRYLIKWSKEFNEDDLKQLIKKDLFVDIPRKLNDKTINIIKKSNFIVSSKINIIEYIKNIQLAKYPVLKYSFLLFTVFIITSIILFLPVKNYFKHYRENICKITNLKGKAYVMNDETRKKRYLKINDRVYETDRVFTGNNAELTLNINKKTFIQLNGNTSIKILMLTKKEKEEKTKIKMEYGESNFVINKRKFGSTFDVETNNLLIEVTGTEFKVKNDENKNSSLFVKRGIVKIKPVLNINKIDRLEKLNEHLAEKIDNTLSSEQHVKMNEKILIEQKQIEEAEIKINELVDKISDKLALNENKKEDIEEIVKESENDIVKIDDINKSLIKYNDTNYNKKDEKNNIENKLNDNISRISNEKIIVKELKINSPEKKYYSKYPILNYEVPEYSSLKIYLNDREVDIYNGEELSKAVNGFNKLKLVLIDENNIQLEKEVNFFLNRINLKDRIIFNESNWTNNLNLGGNINIVKLKDNKLIFIGDGGSNSTSFGLSKWHEFKKESIQKIGININLPEEGNIAIEMGMNKIFGESDYNVTSSSIVTSLKLSNKGEISLYIKEMYWQPALSVQTRGLQPVLIDYIKTEKNVPSVFSEIKKLVFYRKDYMFYSLILDEKDNIIDSIKCDIKKRSRDTSSIYCYQTLSGHIDMRLRTKNVKFEIVDYEFYEY